MEPTAAFKEIMPYHGSILVLPYTATLPFPTGKKIDLIRFSSIQLMLIKKKKSTNSKPFPPQYNKEIIIGYNTHVCAVCL